MTEWFDIYAKCPNFKIKGIQLDPIGHDDSGYSFCDKLNTEIIPYIHCKQCRELQKHLASFKNS